MLHELLLALSGHSSPLLSNDKDVQQFRPLLGLSEDALLRSIASLGNLHIEVRNDAVAIGVSHRSVICQAVSRAIDSVHLARFQEKILEVESSILQKDATLVGAYDIVPLSSIAAAFGGWRSKLEWLKKVVQYMQFGADSTNGGTNHVNVGYISGERASGAQVINWLRKETQTGYPDIERIAISLVQVAERTWLRQVSAWVLYGRLPKIGTEDFMIQQVSSSLESVTSTYNVNTELCPRYVTHATADSILFIGKSLDYIRHQGQTTLSSQLIPSKIGETPLLSSHLPYLSSLEHPINSVVLAANIGAIRSSLSQNVLQKLLPLPEIQQVMRVIHDFFLLYRGDFAIALIAAADDCLSARNNHAFDRQNQEDAHRFGGLMIKEGEVSAVLYRTWATLVALQNDYDDDTDEELDLARDLIRLSIKKHSSPRATTSVLNSSGPLQVMEEVKTTFGDVLLATPTHLSLTISSPLDIFLGDTEVETYSVLHSYLLAVRRAHLHLTDLWKLSTLRRTHPLPGKQHTGSELLRQKRERASQRSKSMRSTWALVGAAAFFLAEFGEYVQGEVVASSWLEFSKWLNHSPNAMQASLGSSKSIQDPPDIQPPEEDAPHDSENLIMAHRAYLTALVHNLLLDDATLTTSLKALFTRLDHVAALVKRLSVVQQHDDLNGIPSSASVTEESELMDSLATVRDAINDNLQSLVRRLGEIDTERLGGGSQLIFNVSETTEFVPWQGGGLYRLLMKLDFARVRDGAELLAT